MLASDLTGDAESRFIVSQSRARGEDRDGDNNSIEQQTSLSKFLSTALDSMKASASLRRSGGRRLSRKSSTFRSAECGQKPKLALPIRSGARKHVLSIIPKSVFCLIYVTENIESFPIKLQHSSKSKPLLLETDNESWEAICHGVPVPRHSPPCSGWGLGFSPGQCQRFEIRNGDGNLSSSFLSHSQFSGVFEGRFKDCNLHHFEFAGLLGKRLKPRYKSFAKRWHL
jgi:hypothetical protein